VQNFKRPLISYPTIPGTLRLSNVHGLHINLVDEHVLVYECRKQNRNAQKILYETYYSKMLPIALRYLKSEEDAMEVINDAFLKVFSKIAQYKAAGSLESWIKRIVINASIDFVRRNKSYKSNFIRTGTFYQQDEAPEENENELTTFQFSKEEILEMVSGLPPASRIVFNLFAIDNYTHREIAKGLNISEGTSKWHLSNARKILKMKLKSSPFSKNKKS